MKISPNEISVIKRETAVIRNYPFPIKDLSITHIKVAGRHPADKTKQHIEHKVSLICYVIEGAGEFIIEANIYKVKSGDAIFIKPNERYFIQGKLEYIVCCYPAYDRAQHEQVSING